MRLLSAIILTAFFWVPMQPAYAQNAVGSTEFDASDRLAIINLITSYGFFFDEGRLDDFRNLFTSDAKFGEASIDDAVEGFRLRVAEFAENNTQVRHHICCVRFDNQSESEARGTAYLELISIQDDMPTTVSVGYYEVIATKADGEWKISHWTGNADVELE